MQTNRPLLGTTFMLSCLSLLLPSLGCHDREASDDAVGDTDASDEDAMADAGTNGAGTDGATEETNGGTSTDSGETAAGTTDASEVPCIVLPTAPGLHVVDGGIHNLAEDICIDVPEGVVGFTVFGLNEAHDFEVVELRSPSGEKLIADGALLPSEHTFRSAKSLFDAQFDAIRPAALGIAVPQSSFADALVPTPGQWHITLSLDEWAEVAESTVELEIAVRGVEQDAPAVVDVNLFRAPATASDAYLEQTVALALAELGLGLGTVTHYALPASADVVDSDIELLELRRGTASAADGVAVNIIAVSELNGLLLDAVVGDSPGIPGATFHHGTPTSALAMEFTETEDDVRILAHEIGHFGGLFHTTDGAIVKLTDPLVDTPECMTPAEVESCPDKGNLMFWGMLLLEQPSDELTEHQRAVLRGSSLYRGSYPIDDGEQSHDESAPHRLADWARASSPETRIALASLCSTSGGISSLPPLAQLIDIANRDDAPASVRKRALQLAGRHDVPGLTAWLASIATDSARPRWQRLGALRGLSRAGETSVTSMLQNDPDPVVIELARSRSLSGGEQR